jgi:hypothetical protein
MERLIDLGTKSLAINTVEALDQDHAAPTTQGACCLPKSDGSDEGTPIDGEIKSCSNGSTVRTGMGILKHPVKCSPSLIDFEGGRSPFI